MKPLFLFALSLVCAIACAASGTHDPGSSSGGPDDGDAGPTALAGLKSLTIDPPSASLSLTYASPMAPATQAFKATGSFDDGSTRDVTASVSWSTVAAPGVGIPSGVFTATIPGSFEVDAMSGTIAAHAKATVKMNGDVLIGVAADAKDKLDASPSGTNPSIAYPIDGALFPSAFATPEFHVQGGPAQGIGRVAFASDLLDLRVYTTCAALTGGCALVLDDTLVPILAGATEAGPLTARARVAGADGSGLGETAQIGVGWTFGRLGGALYFWRAINHDVKTAVSRFNLDAPGTPPDDFFLNDPDSPPLADGSQHPCVGCHAVSHDGKKIGLTFGGSIPSSFALVQVSSKSFIATKNADSAGFATMTAFNPDGSRLINAFRGQLVLRSADASLATIGGPLFGSAGEPVTLPYWSLDGRKIAFVGWQPSQNGAGSSNTGDVVRGGEIFVADADGTAPTADPKLLVPRVQGRTETYPALSDDSALVAFTETRCDGPPTMGPYGNDPCDGYDDPSAKVRLVASAGGAPVDLARANGTDTWTNSWPRFSPKHGTFRGQSLYWLTFSTRRPYGLRLAGSNNGATHPQLWVAAVVLDPKAGPSGDPSFAPVWIPGQNTDMANPTGNHVPQWVSEYVPIIK